MVLTRHAFLVLRPEVYNLAPQFRLQMTRSGFIAAFGSYGMSDQFFSASVVSDPLPPLVLRPEPIQPAVRTDLTRKQVAERLGVSVRSVENWTRAGAFETWKYGRVRRYDAESVERFRQQHRAPALGSSSQPPQRRRKSKRIALPAAFGAGSGGENSLGQASPTGEIKL